jgi:parallel beta-helix repeat protein
VVNHDSGDDWTIKNSTIQNNKGAALMAGARQKVLNNCLRNNGQYAMNAYKDGDSIVGLVVQGNEIVGNNTDDWESRVPGCGCTGGVKFWSVDGADVRANWVHGNHGPGLWADTNNNDFLIEDNLIEGNEGEGLFYETSYNLVLRDNTFRKNALVSGKEFADRGDNFPQAAVYLSESGGEPRIPARTAKIDISGNTFDNNWSGITAWENADRFCNSPANTSSGNCTRLVPTIATCAQPSITSAPLIGDCRWKTQNVDIHDNSFSFDPAVIGCTNGMCGRMAVLSNYGTYPTWSPYKGTSVQNAVTFGQHNVWRGNTYTGPWMFMPFDTARTITAASWQATPYGQDACSNFSGGAPTC